MRQTDHEDSIELLGELNLPPLAQLEAALERRLLQEAALRPAESSDPAAAAPPPPAPLPIPPFPPQLPTESFDLPVPPPQPVAPSQPLAPRPQSIAASEPPPAPSQTLAPQQYPLAPFMADPLALPPIDPANADLPEPLDEGALATPPDAPANLALLRENQRVALEYIMQGIGYAETARLTGIGRRTLFRWAREDPAFQRALDSWRSSAMRSAEDRLLRGAEVAASTLSAAAASDYRAAAILLKGRGLLAGRSSAAEPSSVQAFLQAVPPGKRRVFELRLRELVLSLREESEELGNVSGVVAKQGDMVDVVGTVGAFREELSEPDR